MAPLKGPLLPAENAVRFVRNSLDSTKSALIRFFMKTSMFWNLLTSSNIVWPFICNNHSPGSISIERFMVSQVFMSNVWLLIVINL